VQGARFQLPRGAKFRIDQVKGDTEPLLWVADIVAGACSASRLGGDRSSRAALGELVHLVEIDSGC
jgi:hypothetical protein